MPWDTLVSEQMSRVATREALGEMLKRISHWLPSQAPLKDFIHHNTLHAFQDRPFHEALWVAGRLYGSRNYLPLAEYRRLYLEGGISDTAVRRTISLHAESVGENQILERLLWEAPEPAASEGIAREGIRSRWLREHQVELDSLVHPMLFRFLSNYLDQGISIWRMPHADDRLWSALRRLVKESLLPLGPLSDPVCRLALEKETEDVIPFLLSRIVGAPSHHEIYLLEMLLAHPGWSGMVHVVEKNPATLLIRRPLRLQDAVAVELLLEYAWLFRKLGPRFEPLVSEEEPAPGLPFDRTVALTEGEKAQRIWQEAMEWSLYAPVLRTLEIRSRKRTRTGGPPSAQLFFCIDDRECSLRRHLEETDPSLETGSVAGFFGVDWLFQSAGAGYPTKLCPAPVNPRYLVREIPRPQNSLRRPRFLQLLHLSHSNTLFRGWLITQILGLWHAMHLAWDVFRPSRHRPTDQSLSHIEPQGELQLLRDGDARTEDGLFLGYSIEEMVDRVANVLTSMGYSRNLSPLVVFVAHGASSVNNPYFAAYDCGACSGRPGAPNARAFAAMANDPRVRRGLTARGIAIPESTWFVGAFHDTTRDEVVYFGAETLPLSHRERFASLRNTMEAALRKNARERCRRFELANPGSDPDSALHHVRERASSIFEPRPELNHAANALCIVGRRDLTRGLFLDRRAFLNSYDPETDPEGTILNGILSALVPVCGGINLEYYFSRVDSEIYGSGTKLPHNIMGLVGVANGVEGDLLTGLPTQMTEVHEPLRLLTVVEQEPTVVEKVLTENPAVGEWVRNQWVRLACISPASGRTFFYEAGNFVPVSLEEDVPSPVFPSSLDAAEGRTGNIPVCFIDKGAST